MLKTGQTISWRYRAPERIEQCQSFHRPKISWIVGCKDNGVFASLQTTVTLIRKKTYVNNAQYVRWINCLCEFSQRGGGWFGQRTKKMYSTHSEKTKNSSFQLKIPLISKKYI